MAGVEDNPVDTGLKEEEITTFILNYRLDGIIKTSCRLGLFKKALQAVDEGQIIRIDNSRIKTIVKHAEPLSTSHPEQRPEQKGEGSHNAHCPRLK